MSLQSFIRSLGFCFLIANIGLAAAAPSHLSAQKAMKMKQKIHISRIVLSADKSQKPKLVSQLFKVFKENSKLILKPIQGQTLSTLEAVTYFNRLRDLYQARHVPIGFRVSLKRTGGNHYTLYVVIYYSKVARVGRAVFQGYSNNLIKYYDTRIVKGIPLHHQKYIALAQEIPGVTYSTYFQPAPLRRQRYNLYTMTTLQRVTGFINASNTGNKLMGNGVFGAGLGVHDILGNDELFLRGATSSKPSKSHTFNVTYRKVVGQYGTQIRGQFDYSYAETPPFANAYLFQGTGYAYTLAVYQPLLLNSLQNLSFEGGFTYLDGHNLGITQVAAGSVPAVGNLTTDTGIAYLFGNINYLALDHLGRILVSANITQGVGKLNYSVTGRVAGSSSDGDPKSWFTRFNADFSQLIFLPHQLSLLFNAQGQLANRAPLDASQKFVFQDGAYLSQNFLGDDGISMKAELRYNYDLYKPYLRDIQLYSFGATGLLHNDSTVLIPYKEQSVQTVGFGFRANITQHIKSFFEAAVPFETLPVDNNRDWIFFFGAGYHF